MRVLIASLGLVALISAADAAERQFEVDPFDAVTITSGIDAQIVPGDERSVRAEGDRDIIDKLDVTVRNGRLRIEISRNLMDFLFDGGLREWIEGGPAVMVFVTAPELRDVEARSGSDVTVDGMSGANLGLSASSGAQLDARGVDARFVSVAVSSGGSAEVSGTCERSDVEASSGADARLANLTCQDVRVEASSGGQATVSAMTSIDADASSGGQIDVWGSPEDIRIDTSSGGDVDFRGT